MNVEMKKIIEKRVFSFNSFGNKIPYSFTDNISFTNTFHSGACAVTCVSHFTTNSVKQLSTATPAFRNTVSTAIPVHTYIVKGSFNLRDIII